MRPNIIFYFSDQQRWDTLGCYGQTLPVTPNLDRLAATGVRFSNAYTCQPVCGPARSCLQDGRYATSTGCFTNGIAMDFSRKSLADYFNDAGYETAYVGKWHLATDKATHADYEITAIPKERRGGYKDYWMAADVLEFTSHGYNGFVFDKDNNKVEFTGYRADCINNLAIDYIRNKTTDSPFFMFVSQIEPHHQNDHDRYEGPDGSSSQFKDFERPGDLPEGKGNWKEQYPNYLGCCHSLDYNVGRLIATLKEKGLYENTVIIYTSDHGSHFRTRNQEYKRSCHDGCIHIPLVIHGPGFDTGTVVDSMVSLIDMPATLLDIAGIPVPEDYSGHSVKQLVNSTPDDWQQEVFLQISESQIGRAIRTKQYKYSVRADGDAWTAKDADTYYEDFFYDLEKDPHEICNLVDNTEYAAIRTQLAQRLMKRMQAAGEKLPRILPASHKPVPLQGNGFYYNHI